METILKASKIVKYFNEPEPFSVLKEVSFEVKKGEFLSLVGKSGCGKSTLLYILSTMDTDYKGDLEIQGKQLNGWKRFVPLFVGLWFPVLIVCMNVFGRAGITGTIAGVYSAVAWSLLAIVVYTTKEEPEVVYVSKPAYQLS